MGPRIPYGKWGFPSAFSFCIAVQAPSIRRSPPFPLSLITAHVTCHWSLLITVNISFWHCFAHQINQTSSSPGCLPSTSLDLIPPQYLGSARHRVLWINIYVWMSTQEAGAGFRETWSWKVSTWGSLKGSEKACQLLLFKAVFALCHCRQCLESHCRRLISLGNIPWHEPPPSTVCIWFHSNCKKIEAAYKWDALVLIWL